MLNKLDEFEDAVRKAVSDVRLDNDVVVSVFETNIRVLGCGPQSFSCCLCLCAVCLLYCLLSRGLLGAHVMADLLRQRGERMQWYRDELLHMAKELGHRLLPAFNTTSGLPYPKVCLLSRLSTGRSGREAAFITVSVVFFTGESAVRCPEPAFPHRH